MNHMPRFLRRIAAVAVLLGAWALVGSHRAPIPLMMGAAEAGQGQGTWDGSLPSAKGEKAPHDLNSLRVLTKVILYVKENYVDPKRIKPKEMMISSLEYVEKSVPDVLVDGNPETGKLAVNVNGKTREFDIGHVDSLWKMSFALKDVFDFLSKNMRPIEDTRDIEYAAVNGMLSTLDPHSVLLRPELYREMKLSTKGEFGGLGFVIQMREGNLTVVKVLPKTPAHRAGIQKDDRIKKIGEESTVNMDLNEAVSKLRGPVDSRIIITVERDGWDKPRVMTLARAMISIESVQHKMLSGNVGYIRLKNFQGNTTRDLESALGELRKQADAKGGFKGLVLDMRGNPGGLLEQAIQVSDTFLSNGTIVATVGLSDKLREEKRARPTEGEDTYPIAVLVNAGSASASEIVAGALKNLNRAVIIGRQTFGKGSVQVLYDFPDDSALKLTIAKYLTPGDVSIQEVGIVPDIQLVPTRVTDERVDVFASRRSMGEADLDQHFGNPDSATVAKKREDVLDREKPRESLKYLKVDPKQQEKLAVAAKEEPKNPKAVAASKDGDKKPHGENDPLLDVAGQGEDLDDQLDAESQEEIKEDFEVQFARDYVLKAPAATRQQQLQQGKAFIEQKRREEETRINAAIAALGVDWSAGPTPKNVQLTGTLTPTPDTKIHAGELLEMVVTAENKGAEPLKRVRAWTESDNAFLDRREFLFGALNPGEKKSWKVKVRLPKDLTSRRDDVTVRFFDDQGALPETRVSELNFAELPRPSFAFNWQVVDDCASCNGDGTVQRGESVAVLLDVTNVGPGVAMDSFTQIKNGGDANIFIEKGRFKLGELKAGETKTARFQVEVKKGYKGDTFPLKLAIIDEPLEEFVMEKMELPVKDAPVATLEAKKGSVRVAEKTEFLGSPVEGGRTVAKLNAAAVLPVEAANKGFFRVELEKNRFAFVRAQDAREVKTGKPVQPKLAWTTTRRPPDIKLDADPSAGGLVANGEKFTLSGVVTDPNGLLDVYVLVNDQKVYFKGVDPKGGEPNTLKFSTEFTLKEGNNNVLVVARESTDFASRRTLVIRRRPAEVAQKVTGQSPGGVKPQPQ
ncbi:PDZ domain-containing protein [Myxococcus llanfairpwllgwyngyllgogerychwyrndrobwllllantysiliogogogochensis]|uniref:PDZ domain-containing protein n=1 Tax=Myxococcus llanfairpwllgwyngyllgogerychwyrndrobwllllantysiliogogogochensis TaxID=2590453 RepID=A0A540WY76_9BACT|nr:MULTISPECIES: MXAN_5808 family serine peptidase [Myxococcus]NTX33755.1 PDZ domain-containing protein [Myxococcus sp. CA033]TQF13384.1 PDZ domain-containing protein [Myxococcus llanfairpwllgwyngyllgogerychwyrndrobwllllantysiliogogogochensis]